MTIERLIQRFKNADRETRLETLLDYARKLPALPEHLVADRDQGHHMVPECQTAVYLRVESGGGDGGDVVRLYADVPRESPTVRGFVALLVSALDGQSRVTIAGVPNDLLEQLRLSETLGMMRMQGLSAIVQRIKRAATTLA